MKKEALWLILLGCCLMALYGCATTGSSGSGLEKGAGLLEPSVMVKFSDVPVPAGFKFQPHDSYSFESAGVRVGVLRYRGKAGADQVVNFYKEQMGMYNWNLLNVIEFGDRLLNFERDTETCIINVVPKGKVATVTVSLGPKSQGINVPVAVDSPIK